MKVLLRVVATTTSDQLTFPRVSAQIGVSRASTIRRRRTGLHTVERGFGFRP